MEEYACPAVIDTPTGNLTDLVVDNAAQAPNKVVFSRRVGVSWLDVTCREFLTEVSALAKGLMASGVAAGDRVGLMSRTRYEWTLIDFAIWFAGGVTVPIYETSSAEQVQWILSDSGATCMFIETASHGSTLAEVRDDVSALNRVWTIDAGDLDSLAGAGTGVSDQELEDRRNSAATDSLATIIYTSGTTGRRAASSATSTSSARSATSSMPVARRRASRPSSTTPTPRPCSSCRWLTCSPEPSRSVASWPGPASATRQTSRT
jgi:Long-chain acyl-CoA synthetases (AMP-forming)